jgi:hypothetical protein
MVAVGIAMIAWAYRGDRSRASARQ